MKNLNYLNKYRLDVRHIYGNSGDEHNGAFKVFVNGRSFFVIASNGGGWEHVSVTPCNQKRKTCPTWEEMCQIKAMFFEPEETVIQYHCGYLGIDLEKAIAEKMAYNETRPYKHGKQF